MIKKLKALLIGTAMMAVSAAASAAVWTQTIDENPDIYIGATHTIHHDLSTVGYNPGVDTISDFVLSMKMYDDGDKTCLPFIGCINLDLQIEKAFADLPGIASDRVWEIDNTWYTTTGAAWMTATGILSATGMLDIQLSSLVGDFYLDASTLTASGTKGQAVPEPGALALLGLGLAGLALVRRRSV